MSCLSYVWLFATLWTISCLTPLFMDILQARILGWVAVPSSKGSSRLRDGTHVSYVSCISKRVLYCDKAQGQKNRKKQNKTKQRGPWSAGTENPVPYRPPPCTHVVTINKCQVLWSNITCLPLLPHTEKVFALLFPHPASVPHPVSKWPARPLTGTL